MKPLFFSLVIPAFNESERIVQTLERCVVALERFFSSWEIIVVDDGSIDETYDRAARFAAEEPRVRLLRINHSGKGACVRRGMLAAEGRWRFFADADLSMDLENLPKFLETEADVVISSREGPGARRIGESSGRYVVGRCFNAFVRLMLLRGYRDTQCGFKLFSDHAATRLFNACRIDGFAFDVEVLFLARRWGMTIREVPIVWRQSRRGRVKPKAGVSALLEVLQIRRNASAGAYGR